MVIVTPSNASPGYVSIDVTSSRGETATFSLHKTGTAYLWMDQKNGPPVGMGIALEDLQALKDALNAHDPVTA